MVAQHPPTAPQTVVNNSVHLFNPNLTLMTSVFIHKHTSHEIQPQALLVRLNKSLKEILGITLYLFVKMLTDRWLHVSSNTSCSRDGTAEAPPPPKK